MALLNWQPKKEFGNLRQQINHLFDEIVHGEPVSKILPKTARPWAPMIELKETDTDIILKAQVPGIKAQDLEVQVSSDAVLLSGEYQEEQQEQTKGCLHSEFYYGQFQRTVPLPTPVKNDQIKADFARGILTLTLPKVEDVKRNTVKIDIEEASREAFAKQRQHQEHRQQTLHSRTAAELNTADNTEITEEARASLTEQRQHEEHLQQTMHSRTAAEIANQNNP